MIRDPEIESLHSQLNKNWDDFSFVLHLGILMVLGDEKPEETQRILRHATELQPSNTDAKFWLAKAYFHGYGESQKAKPVLEEALLIDPQRADCLSLLASVETDLNGPSESTIRLLEKAIFNARDWITPVFQIAQLYFKLERFEKAKQFIAIGFAKIGKVALNPIRPIDDIGEYYERCVTGRMSLNVERNFRALLDKIQRREMRK